MMVPKTERFELRLEPSVLERVDVWRGEQGDLPSRAEAIRRLVENGLSRTGKEAFVLTNQQKLIVWLLTEVMKGQKGHDKHEQQTIHLIQEAIYGGHFWALDWTLTGILHDHVDDRASVSLVVNALDMWSSIERAYEKFDAAAKARITTEVGSWAVDPQFLGFDGNNETEYMSIARFLVEEMNRFQQFKGRDFNSHMPTVSRYQHMVWLYEPMRASLIGRDLTVDQVIELLKVRP